MLYSLTTKYVPWISIPVVSNDRHRAYAYSITKIQARFVYLTLASATLYDNMIYMYWYLFLKPKLQKSNKRFV